MFWYFEEKKYRPWHLMKEIGKKLEEMSKADREKASNEINNWMANKGQCLYTPNDKSYWFFLQPRFIKWIFGGNRSGKTSTCAMDVVMQCEGWHPLQRDNLEKVYKESIDPKVKELISKIIDAKYYIRSVPIEARAVCVDFPNGVEKFVGPEVRKWATSSMIKYDGIDNEKKRRIIWNNGSYLEFMSHDQDLDAHGGTARDVVWFDEEPPSDIYQENLMRVIQGGRIIGGMTAVKGITWIKDQIWDRSKEDKEIHAIQMWTEENPVLSKTAIKKISDQCLDDEEREIRLHGGFVARGGNVWKEYKDRFPWVVKPFDIPESGSLILAIDPHLKTEHAALWCWVDYNGLYHDLIDNKTNLYLIKELFEHGTIPNFVRNIRLIESSIGRQHDLALCDPGAWTGDQRDDNTKTTYQQFIDEGVFPIKGSKDLTGGIHKVRQLHICEDSAHPRLMVFSDLTRTRWEHGKYRYPEWRGFLRDERAPREKPIDKDDHMMENMRRIVEYCWDNDFKMIERESKVDFVLDKIDPTPKIYNPDGDEIMVDFEEDETFNARLGE